MAWAAPWWLLAAVAGLGCLYRGRVRAAGAFLGLSAGLQVFPALLLAGPGLALAADSLRRRPSRVGSLPAPPAAYHRRAWEPSQGSHIIDRDRVRLLISALLTLALLFAVSCAGNGIGLWADFFHNSIKHAASTSTNRIGMGQPAAVFGWPGAVTWLLRVGFVSLWLAALLRQRTDADREPFLSCCRPWSSICPATTLPSSPAWHLDWSDPRVRPRPSSSWCCYRSSLCGWRPTCPVRPAMPPSLCSSCCQVLRFSSGFCAPGSATHVQRTLRTSPPASR